MLEHQPEDQQLAACDTLTGNREPNRNLDILRAIAVSVVLVAHCLPKSSPQQALGHYGVLIFFVHTALVLLLSLDRQGEAPGLARRFYLQRAFRIYPLSVLCVLVSLGCRISWPEAAFTPHSGLSITANLLLVQNFLAGPSVSAPLWSLPFEVQMYIVLPAIFLLLRRGTKVTILAVISLALPIAEALVRPLSGGWLTIYVPCFMGGVLAYSRYRCRRWLTWWLWPGVVGAFGIFYWITGQVVPCQWLVCMGLGLLAPVFREAPAGLLSKVAGLIARYSYGVYLAHVPLLWLCFQRLPGLPPAIRWLLFVPLMCIVPVALYHLIEEPMIRSGKAISFRVFPLPNLRSEIGRANPVSLPLAARAHLSPEPAVAGPQAVRHQ